MPASIVNVLPAFPKSGLGRFDFRVPDGLGNFVLPDWDAPTCGSNSATGPAPSASPPPPPVRPRSSRTTTTTR